jgi:uncharacterized Zn finger protein
MPHAKLKTLADAIAELTRDTIKDMVGATIYSRGVAYFKSGAVEDIAYTNATTLEATVSGSDDYEVVIMLDGNGEIQTDCDCPYYDICKHIAAVLLQALDEGNNVEGYPTEASPGAASGASSASVLFQRYVESLSQQELRDLVLRFAPAEFRRPAAHPLD